MQKRKIVNRMFALMLAGGVASPFGIMSAKASNWSDTPYSRYYNGDGGDVATPKRQKQDASYVYIKHMGDVGASVSVRVVGYSGNYTKMNGNGSYVAVPLGKGYKITNYVAESFPSDYRNGRYKTIYLQLMPEINEGRNPCRAERDCAGSGKEGRSTLKSDCREYHTETGKTGGAGVQPVYCG